MLTPASARSRAISPIAPGLSWRSTTTASRSSATLIPAASRASRAAAASSTRMWMKPLPSPTIAQRPAMLMPALPVASPRSASFPGWSSMITVRSFIGPPSVAALHHMQSARVKWDVRGTLDEMANRLAQETSPYLLQHKDNPVEWEPWGPDALGRAVREDKPILLSIGYSACHWCHVMEREPFYGGTYFPPEPRQGMPSFKQVLEATAGAYGTQREELREASARIRDSLGAVGKVEQSQEPLDQSTLARAISGLQGGFDRSN